MATHRHRQSARARPGFLAHAPLPLYAPKPTPIPLRKPLGTDQPTKHVRVEPTHPEQRLTVSYATARPDHEGTKRHAVIVSLGSDRVAAVLSLTPTHGPIVTSASKPTQFYGTQAEFCIAALDTIRRDMPHLIPRAAPPPIVRRPLYPEQFGEDIARQRRYSRRHPRHDRDD